MGAIAIVRLTKESAKHSEDIARRIMSIHKNVKTVLLQTTPIGGEFRVRKLQYVAGERTAYTTHKESKCVFNVDVAKCYFSPRLFNERVRIAEQVSDGEVIVNMFAGVGCFSILIAKQKDIRKIYSIDLNPAAIGYMKENIRLNRAFGKVIPMLGDAKEIIESHLSNVADRVLMPLPQKALEYLPSALLALKPSGGWIHYYDFQRAKKPEDPVESASARLIERLKLLSTKFEVCSGRVVRTTGPCWYQVALDIRIR